MYKIGEKKVKSIMMSGKTREINISSYYQENNRGNWSEKKRNDNIFLKRTRNEHKLKWSN